MKIKNEKLKLNIQKFAQSDAEVKFKVVLDDNNAGKQLDDLSDKGNKATSTFSKIGSIGKSVFKGVAIGIGTATTALGGLVAKSVQMAGELEQNIGGTEAVFKDFSKTVQEQATKAYSSMGVSASDYMATINKMGSLMQGSGIDIETSMNLSSEAMQRAADVASIMGIDINSAMESIAGAAKGNFTMMDNLGVAMNETTLESYALSKGIDKTYSSMSNGEKIQLAMEMFLEKSSYAMGNYTKENKTFAGSLTTMKAAISNFMSGAGGIEPVIESVMSFVNILVDNIGKMAPQIVSGIIDLINGLVPQLPVLLQKLLPSIIDGAITLIQGLVSALPQLIPVLMNGIVQAFTGIIKILPELLNALLEATIYLIQELANQLPTLIPTLIEAILNLIPILLQNLPLFIDAGIQLLIGLATGLVNAIPILVEMLPQIIESLITGLLTAIPQILSIAPQIIMALATGLIKSIPTLVKSIPQIVMAIVNGFKNGIGNMLDIGKNLVQGLWNGINNAKKWVLDKIKGFGKSIVSGIKGIFGIHSPSKVMFEIGGYLDKGFINGIEDMEKDINKQVDATFGSGLDYLYNGYDNFSMSLPNTSSTSIPTQTIYLNNASSNSNVLQVDGKVLAEIVNNYNTEREVAV